MTEFLAKGGAAENFMNHYEDRSIMTSESGAEALRRAVERRMRELETMRSAPSPADAAATTDDETMFDAAHAGRVAAAVPGAVQLVGLAKAMLEKTGSPTDPDSTLEGVRFLVYLLCEHYDAVREAPRAQLSKVREEASLAEKIRLQAHAETDDAIGRFKAYEAELQKHIETLKVRLGELEKYNEAVKAQVELGLHLVEELATEPKAESRPAAAAARKRKTPAVAKAAT